MVSTRRHRCEEPGCRELIPLGARWCDKHYPKHHAEYEAWKAKQANDHRRKLKQRRYNQTKRDDEANAFYHSPQWTKVRNYIYARDLGTCQVCGEVITDRKIADHIVPRRLDKTKQLDTTNLWLLCYSCHTAKTQLEETITSRPNGINILTHADRDWWAKAIKHQRKI